MKTIGLIGGMSWESTVTYYQIINQSVKKRLGGLHSAKSILYSVDFAEIEVLQREGRWDQSAELLARAARSLQAGGADCIVVCTNTMHKVAAAIQESVSIPLIHIADATARQVQAAGIQQIGLLGTRFTMEEDFYKERLIQNYGLDVRIPDSPGRAVIHRVIYEELVLGNILPASRTQYLQIMSDLIAQGAQGVILGCTEIGLLVSQADSPVPLFDTTRIHAEAAVDYALE